MSEGWQPAFVAMTVALGDSVDEALLSLGVPPGATTPQALAALARGLRADAREVRTRALAQALSAIALAVEAQALA